MRLTSFPPVVTQNATVLILGSMPGSRSLRAGQYYAHPHNFFWPFMAEIFGVEAAAPYAERLQALQTAGVALWDVLKECEREGSLDTAIVPASELPNDFGWLLTTYPTIQRICLNGSKAATAFTRLVLPTLPASIQEPLTLIPLPSTSPANRSIPTAVKLERWHAALLS
ncbi:MAG: DNA-deoxyinosine glycosylase [Caldilineaceae bacterium]|nr:DNA-deoxyinosine glycosylase [Caldilineaceae bacterium]